MTIHMRSLLSKLALIVGSLAATLAFAEIGVRVLGLAPAARSSPGGDSVQAILQFDNKLETRYKPHAHTTIRSQYGEFVIEYDFNELGLRDRPLPIRAQDGAYRVLALGNSFVEGWGVPLDDTFLRVAEQQWNQNRSSAQRPVRLINAGASGYGAAQCYLLLQELLPTVQPDAVVFFYVPTMISADQKYVGRADRDNQGLVTGLNIDALLNQTPAQTATAGNGMESPLLKTLARFSHLTRFVMARVANYQALSKIVPGDAQTDLLAAYRAPSADVAALSAPSVRHIEAMAAVARKAGVPFLVVQLPMPFEVSPIEWDRGRQLYKLDASRTNSTALRQHTADFCATQGITCVAAHEYLAAKAAQDRDAARIYFPFDFHLNDAGQHALGQWLAEVFSQRFAP